MVDWSCCSVSDVDLIQFAQPKGLKTRTVLAGLANNLAAGRKGRRTNSPLQFGQRPLSFSSTQDSQNVHSKVQIIALRESGARSQLQHSQFGRSCSIGASFCMAHWCQMGTHIEIG
jgi:hypothetical protein